LVGDAGVRRRQRPRRRLLGPGSRRGRAPIRPVRSAIVSTIRGKEVVRRWRLRVRAVEVPARRGVSPRPDGESSSQRGGLALRAAFSAGSASTKNKLVTALGAPQGAPSGY